MWLKNTRKPYDSKLAPTNLAKLSWPSNKPIIGSDFISACQQRNGNSKGNSKGNQCHRPVHLNDKAPTRTWALPRPPALWPFRLRAIFLPPRPRAGIFAQPPGRGIPQKLFSPLHRCGPESQISERMRRVGSKWIWGNKFSAAEQWAEFHNDEALGLVFESERERERERQRNNVAEVVSLLQAFVITKGIFLL